MSQKLTKDTLDFLKTHFSIRTWKEIFAANEAEARYRDRVKTFAKRERNRVENLLEDANKFINERYLIGIHLSEVCAPASKIEQPKIISILIRQKMLIASLEMKKKIIMYLSWFTCYLSYFRCYITWFR